MEEETGQLDDSAIVYFLKQCFHFTKIWAVIYSLMYSGGYILMLYESEVEKERSDQFMDSYEAMVLSLGKLGSNFTRSVDEMNRVSRCQLPIRGQYWWDLEMAAMYMGSVFTTIGLGFIAPSTEGGRIFTIVFGMFTMVVYGLCVGEIAKIFIGIASRFFQDHSTGVDLRRGQTVQDGIKMKGDTLLNMASIMSVENNARELDAQYDLITKKYRVASWNLNVSSFVVAFFLVGGAIFFNAVEENWSFIDAFYYCFTILTTIGLGDLVLFQYLHLNVFIILSGGAVMAYLLKAIRTWLLVRYSLKVAGDARARQRYNLLVQPQQHQQEEEKQHQHQQEEEKQQQEEEQQQQEEKQQQEGEQQKQQPEEEEQEQQQQHPPVTDWDRTVLQSIKPKLQRGLGSCAFVTAYTALGGVLFSALELGHEKAVSAQFWATHAALYAEWQAPEHAVEYETAWTLLHMLHEAGLCPLPRQRSFNWEFKPASLYSLTIISTVGYGTYTPQTDGGKMVTVVYGFLGIVTFYYALMLLARASLDVLAEFVSHIAASRWQHTGLLCPQQLKMGLSALFFLLVLLLGTVAHRPLYQLSTVDALYFSFITSTTTGLGDIAPSGHGAQTDFALVYIVLSCSIVAYLLSNLVELLSDKQLELKLLANIHATRVVRKVQVLSRRAPEHGSSFTAVGGGNGSMIGRGVEGKVEG